MDRIAIMPMHAAAHVITRAFVSNPCVTSWTDKAYGARRLGSSST